MLADLWSRWLGWARDVEHARRAAILARTPLFAGLPKRLLNRLAGQLFEKSYAPAEEIFHEGDPGKGLFVILEGHVDVVRETPQGELRLASFGPGTAFGELALIDDLPRSATARATSPARLLILYRTHFETLVEGDRGIALAVARNLLRTLSGYVRVLNTTRLARPEPAAPVTQADGASTPGQRATP